MVHILGISGSLRKASLNSALLRAAAQSMPSGAVLEIGTIAGIPLYDGDVEAEHGIPEPVARLKDAIARADGLLLVTPEYNNSIPGPFKNAIDWATRPASDIAAVFGGKTAALMGASPGAFGTVLSQSAWLPVLRTLGVDLWTGGRLMVTRADDAFDDGGDLVDPRVRQRLEKFLSGFVGYLAPDTRSSPSPI